MELAVGTPDHTVNTWSATVDAVSHEAAHRLVSLLTHPHLRDGYRIRASVIAKRLMWGQQAVTPESPKPQIWSLWSRPSGERASPRWRPGQWDPRIFTKGQWRRAGFLNHPEVKLTMSVNASDYQAFIRSCPIVAQTVINAMTDTGIHSCL